jgi:NADPH-dependent curcumin reductase CurA
MNVQVRLKSRPIGVPQAEHFELVKAPIVEPEEGQVQIQIFYVSVDPAMRGWVNAAANYAKPVEIGAVMKSYAVGRITASRHKAWRPGDVVHGLFGWQQWATVNAEMIDRKIDQSILGDFSLSATLGILGLNGVTAYFGLLEIGKPKAGETVVVSSGVGSVGSCVGQIAKILGCRTVAVAGGQEKARLAREYFGFDASVDYKSGQLDAQLKAACHSGIDVYFDNTSGPVTDAVMGILNAKARIVICGTVAYQDWSPPPAGPRPERQLMVTRSRMEGFVAPDYQSRWDEAYSQLSKWMHEGKLKYKEEVLEGLESAPGSIAGLYRGENFGKRVIRVADEA